MVRSYPLAVAVFLSVCILPGASFGLNEPSHALVNEQAASASAVDRVMREELAISEGLQASFIGSRVRQWIRLGGTLEDAGSYWDQATGKARSYRHFHDPLQPWDRAGLSYSPPLLPQVLKFESSVRWAQRTDQNAQTR